MAVFNPQVKDEQAQNFTGASKSIDKPDVNRSSEFALKGIGSSLEGGFKAADQIQEDNVKQQVTTAQQKELDYELAYRQNEAGAGDDLLKSVGPPQAIANYQDKADLLKMGADSGKYPSIYFESRQLAIAKEYREKYPGYRDTIDNTTSKVLGHNPANALRESLTAAANDLRNKKDKENEKVDNELWSHLGMPGVAEILQARKSGNPAAVAAIKAISTAEGIKSDLELTRLKLSIQNEQEGMSERQRKAGQEAGAKAWDQAVTNAHLNSMNGLSALGVGKDSLGTPENAQKIADRENNNTSNVEEDTRNNILAAESNKQVFRQQMLAMASQRGKPTEQYPNGTPSIIEQVGLDRVLEPVNKRNAGVDDVIKFMSNNEYGPLNAYAQQTKALEDKTTLDLSKDPNFGPYMQIYSGVKKAMGDQGASLFMQDAANRNLFSNPFTALGEYYKSRIASGQPAPGQTLSTVIDTMQKANAGPEAYENLLKLPDIITNTTIKDPAKLNTLNHTYTPERMNFLSKFSLDGNDVLGRFTPGMETVYSRFFSPAVTENAFRLGKENQTTWNNYVASAEEGFKIGLVANNTLHDLSKVSLTPGAEVSYSTEKNKITVIPPSIAPYQGKARVVTPVDRAVASINRQLQPLAEIAKKQGTDVRVLLALALQGQEGNPLYIAILDSVKASVMKPKPPALGK